MTMFLDKDRTMDNVQKHNICNKLLGWSEERYTTNWCTFAHVAHNTELRGRCKEKSFASAQWPFHATNTSRIPNLRRNFHNNVTTFLSHNHSPPTSSIIAFHSNRKA
jgi:hypothetical protein